MNARRKALLREREWLAVYRRGRNRGSAERWKARNNRKLTRIAARN